MQRFSIPLACLVLLAAASVGRAQENQAPLQRRPNLLVQQHWLRVMIVDGRLTVAAISDSQPSTNNTGNVRQRLSVSMTSSGPTLDFEIAVPNDKLHVHIQGDEQATLRREYSQTTDPKAGAGGASAAAPTIVEYTQAPQQPVKLSVTENGETRSVEGASIWHLLMFEPALSERYLVPVLEMLRLDWHLMATAYELKQVLLQAARTDHGVARPDWAELVAQLADEHYAVRQRAERELRGAGRAALPYLQSLQRNKLDAEQWNRVNEIIAASSDDREDTPDRMAARLVDDRSVWLGLLADSQELARQIAAQRLSALTGGPIDFDPAASQDTRSKQLAALRSKLAPKR